MVKCEINPAANASPAPVVSETVVGIAGMDTDSVPRDFPIAP
jgi:hypothetical protein